MRRQATMESRSRRSIKRSRATAGFVRAVTGLLLVIFVPSIAVGEETGIEPYEKITIPPIRLAFETQSENEKHDETYNRISELVRAGSFQEAIDLCMKHDRQLQLARGAAMCATAFAGAGRYSEALLASEGLTRSMLVAYKLNLGWYPSGEGPDVKWAALEGGLARLLLISVKINADLGRHEETIAYAKSLLYLYRHMEHKPEDLAGSRSMILFTIGVEMYRLGRYEEALELYSRMYRKFDTPESRHAVAYNIGALNARLYNAELAVQWLEKAAPGYGASFAEEIEADADFDGVRGAPVFQEFMAEIQGQ